MQATICTACMQRELVALMSMQPDRSQTPGCKPVLPIERMEWMHVHVALQLLRPAAAPTFVLAWHQVALCQLWVA